jgi:hypothetical protein
VGWVGLIKSYSRVSRVGLGVDLHGLDRLGRVVTSPKRVESKTSVFEFFLPAPVLDSSFLMGHGLDRGHGYNGSDLTHADFF